MWNWLKKLLGIHSEPVVLNNEVQEEKIGHCDKHSKYKHRCPDCVEILNG